MRLVRAVLVVLLVAVLAGLTGSAQAGSSGLHQPVGTPGVAPSMIGEASRVDVGALIRTGTRTRPTVVSFEQRPRAAPRLATITAAGSSSNTVSSTSTSSPNWSGYVVGDGPYTSVTGTFTVPNLAATPTETVTSEWVGIDGANGPGPLIQAGAEEVYEPSTNLVYTRAWWEILPAPETLIPSVPVSPGDTVTVTIWQVSGSLWGITVADDATGQSFTTDQTYSGPGTSAEWIVEAPTNSLTNTEDTLGAYNPPVTFSNLRMNGPETSLTALSMVQGGVTVSVPSALTSTTPAVPSGRSPGPS